MGLREVIPNGIRLNILRDLEKDRPSFADWNEWIEAKAVIYEVPAEKLQQVFAQHVEMLDTAITLQSQPLAQKIAAALGVTRSKAIAKLDELLCATKVKYLTNRQGEVVDTVESPDRDVQLRAAIEVLKIHGAYAPQQFEIKEMPADDLKALSDEELRRATVEAARIVTLSLNGNNEYSAVMNGASSMENGGERKTGSAGETAQAPVGAAGPAGVRGPVLLADGMHQDAGRAG